MDTMQKHLSLHAELQLKLKGTSIRLLEKFFGVGDFSPENNEAEAIGS